MGTTDRSPATDVPVACTLDPAELPDRLARWRQLAERSASRRTTDRGVHLDLAAGTDLKEVVALVAAEQACCAFFTFVLTVGAGGIGLDVQAPDGAAHLAGALFDLPV